MCKYTTLAQTAFYRFVVALGVLIFLFSAEAGESDSVRHFAVDSLTVNDLDPSQAIGESSPRFGWKLKSDERDTEQTAWRLRLFRSPSPGKVEETCFWDSGRIADDRQTFIPYTGPALPPGQFWRLQLTVWDNHGATAQTQTEFATGLYPTETDANPWKGSWIGYPTRHADPGQLSLDDTFWIAPRQEPWPPGNWTCRKTFVVHDPESVAIAMAGDDLYKLWLNGQQVLFGRLTHAVLTDVSRYVVPGENTCVVEVTNGGPGPGPTGILGVILVRDRQGQTTRIPTDTTWRWHENFDRDSFSPDYRDSDWSPVAAVCRYGQGPWGKNPEPVTKRQIPEARYLLRRIALSNSPVVRATVWLCGLGYNHLYLNGRQVDDHQLNPAPSDFKHRVFYNTYDVTEYLRGEPDGSETANSPGNGPELTVGVILGNGRFHSPRPESSTDYGEPRLLFQMAMEYADGTTRQLVSDENWLGSDAGPVQRNNDYDGESQDARREQPATGTAIPTFGPDNYFMPERPATVLDPPDGILVPQPVPPVRVTEELKPRSVVEVRPGIYVFDFGQNFCGNVRMAVCGLAGQEVTLRFGETLQTDGPDAGRLYVDNLRSAEAKDVYILKGTPAGETFVPVFASHGFRYVELTGFPGTPNSGTLTGQVLGTDLPRVGYFECDSELVNALFRNVCWGIRSNYLGVPVDCPQRDERQGWLGDRAHEAQGEMFLFENRTLYRKWLQDMADSQLPDGRISDVCPNYWPLYETNLTWPSTWTFVPDLLHEMDGDMDAIARYDEARRRWLTFMTSFLKEDGTIDRDIYGDWCVPPESQTRIHSEDPNRRTSPGILASCYLYRNYCLAAKYALLLGKRDEAADYTAQASNLREAFQRVYYQPATGQYDNGTQTSSVLPLAFGLVPETETNHVVQTLVRHLHHDTDDHIGTGMIGIQWLLQTLTANGHESLAWKLATNTDYPGWGYMLSHGATTIWELWNGDTADPAMNSGNHVMLVGDLVIWLFEDLAGIRPDPNEPGFRRVIMRPVLPEGLNAVRASYDSIRGRIASRWDRDPEQGTFRWTVTIPPNATGRLLIPCADPNSLVCEDGDLSTLVREQNEPGRVILTVPSGTWTFVSRLR